jgi:hypothetical protein
MAGSPWLALRRTRSSFFMSHPSNLDLEDIPFTTALYWAAIL